MRFIKKGLLFCLIIALLIVPIYGNAEGISAVTNSSWFKVEVAPPNAGARAEYHIYGGISDYDGIDRLNLYLDWTHYIYDRPDSSMVTVNGVEVNSVSMEEFVEERELKISIALGQDINKGDSIDIKINKGAGIINPDEPRPCYQISVYLLRNGVQICCFYPRGNSRASN